MVPLKILKPVLIGKQHYIKDQSVEVEDNRARSLIESGHAAMGDRVRTATAEASPRRASRLTGRAE